MLVGAVGAGCFVSACAGIFGINNAETDASAQGDAGDGGATDAQPDYVFYDKIPIDANTAFCDGGIPLVAADQAFWVSGKLGKDVLACGTQAQPCKTLNFLLPTIVADAGIHTVYLDNSNFQEQINLGSAYRGFTIQGGFVVDDAGAWTPACANNLTSITTPDDGGAATVFIHNMLDAGVTLRLLQIESKTNGTLGESVYAVVVVDSDVLLDNVNLYAQNGGPGAYGGNGATGVACNPVNGTGSAGGSGDAGGQGAFLPALPGYVPSVGQAGGGGDFGHWAAPSPSTCGSSCVTGCN